VGKFPRGPSSLVAPTIISFFLVQLDLWTFFVFTRAIALYNSLIKNPTKNWEANPPLLMGNLQYSA
jgi:hypothetical protein